MSQQPNDGLIHEYFNCPKCGRVIASEDLVTLNGQKMCRQTCLRNARELADLKASDRSSFHVES
jgi:hypothetical protein